MSFLFLICKLSLVFVQNCVYVFQCVVQSYLQWLQDSDYDPTCRLCGKNLADDGCGKCVRLQCYGKVTGVSI